jgi:hypothetical protein
MQASLKSTVSMRKGPPMKCLIGDGLIVIKIGGGQDYLTGNIFRDYKQGFSGFKGSQG